MKILFKALHILHMMSQRQYDFTEKHFPVEQQYVKFVCGFNKVLKDLPGNYDHEGREKIICVFYGHDFFLT